MRQRGISSRSRFVLLVLGNASSDWKAYYSLTYLAEQTLLSEKSCEIAIAALQKAGCLGWLETTIDLKTGETAYAAKLNERRSA